METFRGHFPRKGFDLSCLVVTLSSSLTFNICLAPASTTLLLAFFILSRKLMVIDVIGTKNESLLANATTVTTTLLMGRIVVVVANEVGLLPRYTSSMIRWSWKQSRQKNLSVELVVCR
jgi:hypothetical protein